MIIIKGKERQVMIRTSKVLIQSFYRPHLGFYGTSVLHFRVGITDLDFNFHMNNSKFLKLADLSRWDFILRTGMWRLMLKNKWQPVVGGLTIRFRHSLSPFEKFRLQTILYGWDEKWLYFLHKFVDKESRLTAVALSRATMRDKEGGVSIRKVAQLLHPDDSKKPYKEPELPSWVHDWISADQELYDDAKAKTAHQEFRKK